MHCIMNPSLTVIFPVEQNEQVEYQLTIAKKSTPKHNMVIQRDG